MKSRGVVMKQFFRAQLALDYLMKEELLVLYFVQMNDRRYYLAQQCLIYQGVVAGICSLERYLEVSVRNLDYKPVLGARPHRTLRRQLKEQVACQDVKRK